MVHSLLRDLSRVISLLGCPDIHARNGFRIFGITFEVKAGNNDCESSLLGLAINDYPRDETSVRVHCFHEAISV
jgi:hypothetical protein